MKFEESLNVTLDESPPPTKLSPLVDDDVGGKEAIRKNTKVVNYNNEEDELIEVDEIIDIKESKNLPLDQVIGNLNQRTLRLEDSKPTKMPMSTEMKLTKDDEVDSVDSSKYQGTKMPNEYQQDYKKTRAYAQKNYNDPNMSNELRDIYRTLENSRALKDDPNMSKEQMKTRGMFKNFGRALHNFARMLKKGCR
ncbi:hypothetical protein Tco_1028593 [Tanacetum coccineum]|uniref:Uncharacterized protein n=1 Tax=Tanacetum coccineum TaxID=301880 RepID=A0ABQ5G374_9ASTR